MESRGASLSSERLRHRCITRAGAACQWGRMHGRATRCSLVAGVVLAATWTPTYAEPHCKVKGYYQATPFVFACDGSGGETETNKAAVSVPGNSLKDIATIPAGTQDFDFKVTGDSSATIEIIDASVPKIVVPDSLRKTGPGTWQGSHGDTTIRYTVSDAGERVTFSGTASTELKLGLKNTDSEEAEYTLGYYYFPFSSGPQCKLGGAPLGCKPYDQYTTQDQVTQWANWLAGEHPDPNDAWEQVMSPLSEKHQGYAVPPQAWCKAWSQWPGAASSPTSCESAYKFVTGGGHEVNVKDIYQTQFTWAHSLGKIAEFDHRCCTHIKKKYKHKDNAWNELKAIALSSGSESACDGLLEVCKKLKPVPPNRDYCLYLDADGYPGSGTVVIEDIAHCFGEVPTLAPEPREAPMVEEPEPLPEAPEPPLGSQPEPAATNGRHHFRHHVRPTPQPTPAPTPMPTAEQTLAPATPAPTPMVVSPTQENGTKVGIACVLGPMIWIRSLKDNYLIEDGGEVWRLAPQSPAQGNWRLSDAGNSQVFIVDNNGNGLSKADTGHYQVSAEQGQWERWDFASAGNGYLYLTGGDSLQLQDAGGYARAAYERGSDEKWMLTMDTGDFACHPVQLSDLKMKAAKQPWFPTDGKRIGLMVGGGVAGALAAGAAVAGVGVLINQMKAGDSSKAQEMRTQGLPSFRGIQGISTTLGEAENSTTTSWPEVQARENVFENISGKSDSIMVPLIALCVVCVLGILLLGIAAYLDPCGGRKTSKRALADQSNSVASVQSVDTYESEEDSRYMQSEEDDDYWDHEPGSSVAEWDYDQVSQTDYPQEPWPETNLGGYNSYGQMLTPNGSPVLAGEQVLLAVFDFDLTLTRNHLWKMYTTRDLSRIPVYDDTFVDLAGFREFVHTAGAVGCRVAVVTFGRKDVVKKAMSYALGNGSHIDISSPEDLGLREGSDELGNKNSMLTRLAQRHRLKRLNQIVFVDDDPLHVRAAASIGVQAVPAPSGANREVLRRVAATIQDRSPSYSVARR